MIDTTLPSDAERNNGPPSASSSNSWRSPRGHTESQFYGAEHVFEWSVPGFGRVRFTDHATVPFRAVRARFGYRFEDLERALGDGCRYEASEGKSDAVFFSTHNKRFLFKTLRGAEPENLKAFLPEYLSHVSRYPSTLLPRYLGLYTFERLSVHGVHHGRANATSPPDDNTLTLGNKFTIVCMANVFDTPLEIHSKFDFKGSNIGRRALPEDLIRPVSMNDGLRSAQESVAPEDSHSVRVQRSVDERSMPGGGERKDREGVTLKELDYQRLVAVGKAGLFL
ncbi:hypothetical protein HK097_004538, partial [Rhizophlyctis rosea]